MAYPQWLLTHPYAPPNDVSGDLYADSIYAAVGKITHSWEIMEGSLSNLFVFFNISPNNVVNGKLSMSSASRMTYGTINSSSNRIEMLKAASKSFSKAVKREDYIPSFEKICKVVHRLTSIRNIAAHGVVASLVDSHFEGIISYEEIGAYFICPAFHNTAKTTENMAVKYWYNSKTMLNVAESIQELDREICKLTYETIAGHENLKYPIKSLIMRSDSTHPILFDNE